MNKTKRKIFETSMKLFAEKGYDATSVEEITATVGVAKGTLYYHFSSKEEIFTFLVEEGMKLLHNSVEIKTENLTNTIDKIRAVILIQLKVMKKYDEFITILLSQIWGNESRHQQFRAYIYNYITYIEGIIKEGVENNTFCNCDTRLIAEMLFGMICPLKIYKLDNANELINEKIIDELMGLVINGILKENNVKNVGGNTMLKEYKDLKILLNYIEKEFSEEVGFKLKKNGNIEEVKYSEYVKNVKAFGEYLLNLELSNYRIAFIAPNRYEWAVTYMAVATSNCISVPLDRSLPENEFRALLVRSEAEVLVYDDKYSSSVEKFKQDPEIKVKYYINMDNDFDAMLSEGMNLLKNKNNKYDNVKIENEDMKFMLFTSGTTSASKCVMLSHKNICSNIASITENLDINKNDVVLSFLPLHHTFECTAGFLFVMSKGAKICYCDGIRHFANNLKEYGVTVFINVPAMIEGLYKNVWKTIEKNKKEKKVKLALKASSTLMKVGVDVRANMFKQIHEALGGKIRFIVSGAAALSSEISKTLSDMGIIIYQGYGLTETAPVLSVEKKGEARNGSVGKALPGVEVKIKDPNEEGIGEIIAKGSNVMLGYYNDEEATKAVLNDGWFSTGDLGKIDKDGFIFITGRKKDVIVLKNGKNVFPDELENLINKLDAVNESIVFGVMDAEEDIILNAKIVYNAEEFKEKFGDLTESEIKEYYWNKIKTGVNKKMPTYKYIKNIIITTEPLIRTTTNKVKRFEEMKLMQKQGLI